MTDEGQAILRQQAAADQLQAMITTIVNALDDCEATLNAGLLVGGYGNVHHFRAAA